MGPWGDGHALDTRAMEPPGRALWWCKVPPTHSARHARALVAKLCVAAQLIITRDPAMGYLLPPRVEHLQALLLSRVIPYLLWHVACLASKLVVCPCLGQRQAEVEQGMIVLRD